MLCKNNNQKNLILEKKKEYNQYNCKHFQRWVLSKV